MHHYIMKTTTVRICTLGIACCAGLTFAQDGGRRAAGGEGGANRLAEFIKKVDANGDGKITKDEFLAYSKKEAEERFAKMDANGDGVVDEAEIKAAAEKLREGGGRRGEGAAPGGGRRAEGAGAAEGGFRRPPTGEAGKPPAEGERPQPPASPEGRRPEGGPPPGREGGRPGGFGAGALGGNPEELFKTIDKNGDGTIDAAEYREFSAQEVDNRFKRIDANSDGKISPEEFKQAMSAMRRVMGGGEGGMRRPGGPGAPGSPGGEGGGFRRPPSGDAPQGARRPPPEGDKKPEDAK
ncbi:MAG: h [Rhizorhabdus sp.]|nr:h [Rhizorhabdus sp.]